MSKDQSASRPERFDVEKAWERISKICVTHSESLRALEIEIRESIRSERGTLTYGFSDKARLNVLCWIRANIQAEQDDDDPESVRLLEKIAALLDERTKP